MIPANNPVQRRADAKLLTVRSDGEVRHAARSKFPELLRSGDVVIANDAATLPASLFGVHLSTGAKIEVRLAGRTALHPRAVKYFSAVVFGDGDFHTPTEDRSSPPDLRSGDALQLGPLRATILRLLDHPRLVLLRFEGSTAEIWEGLARHGRPIQYAHIATPLDLWDVWTPIAGPPVAFESPSASFLLNWAVLDCIATRRVQFGTITHAAGISSTGDPDLDGRLPLDEPYRIPEATVNLIRHAQERGGRVIAIGTTVVRALEHAAETGVGLRSGEGLATQTIGPQTKLRIVDAIVSGTHERGSSHYQLLRAFVNDEMLEYIDGQLKAHRYLTHEFGDSIFVERMAAGRRSLKSHQPASRTEVGL